MGTRDSLKPEQICWGWAVYFRHRRQFDREGACGWVAQRKARDGGVFWVVEVLVAVGIGNVRSGHGAKGTCKCMPERAEEYNKKNENKGQQK